MEIKSTYRRSSILLGERQTTLFNRVSAKSIDGVVIVAIYFLGAAIWLPLGVLLAATLCTVQDAMGIGQSIGKRIIGLKVIDDATGATCTVRASFLRNFPLVLAVFFAAIPALWVFLVLFALPVLALEIYLLFTLESGVRLGDVLGNTLVVEYLENEVGRL